MPSSVGRTLAIDDSCWYRWILILGRMGSRLLSRLIIILQFRTEFHHLPQTQLIRYRRQRAGSGSLCRVVFALGQAKFCVFANFIRIARLFWHFSQGNWLLSLFSCVVFKRMQKICETSPWLVAFERTCSYQFSLWETLKKQIIHTGILDFWLLAAQFPQSVPATANGSQTWFFSNADERQEKWVNVFRTAYFFGQGPLCRPTTHINKSIYRGRSPNVWGIVEKGLR